MASDLDSVQTWTPIVVNESKGAPAQPFLSAAVRAGDFVYVSGVIGVRPGQPGVLGEDWTPGELVKGGIAAQTRQSMVNISATLEAAGLSLADVVKVNAYLLNKDRDFGAFNEVYLDFFPGVPPARTAVGATILGEDVLVEIECVAYAGS